MGDEGDAGLGGTPSIGGDDGMGGITGDAGLGTGFDSGMGLSEGLGSLGSEGSGVGFGIPGLDSPISLADIDVSSLGDMGLGTGFDSGIGLGPGLGLGLSGTSDEGILGKLGKMAQQMAINTVLGKLGLNNPVGKGTIGLAQAAMNPDQDQGKNQAFNSVFNGIKGMAMSANPVAGLAMGLASAFGMPNQGMTGNAAPGVSMGNNSGGFSLSDIFRAAGDFRNFNKASGALDKQIGGLEGLFSPNSPYAQQMRQQLERRDAAAGRRSQYGPREVELMAALAQQAARSAPQLNQLQNQRAAMRGQGLQALLNFGQQSGITPWMANGLQGLFNSGISSGVSSGFLPSDTSGMNFSQYEQDPFSALGEF